MPAKYSRIAQLLRTGRDAGPYQSFGMRYRRKSIFLAQSLQWLSEVLTGSLWVPLLDKPAVPIRKFPRVAALDKPAPVLVTQKGSFLDCLLLNDTRRKKRDDLRFVRPAPLELPIFFQDPLQYCLEVRVFHRRQYVVHSLNLLRSHWRGLCLRLS